MKTFIKKSLNSLLRSIGLELRAIELNPEPPTFFDCPTEALLFQQGGKPSVFQCPMDKVTHVTGLGLTPNDWHPFVETITQYQADQTLNYDQSALKRFYDLCQPKTAAESVFGFDHLPARFQDLPAYMVFLLPWVSQSEADVTQDTLWWNRKDNAEHGRADLNYPTDGWAYFGPVSNAKGELEFRRTLSIYDSIKTNGYDATKGGIGVTLLKRGDDYRYLLGGGGYHRAVALKSAGYKTMNAAFHRPSVVDVADVEHWPNVKNGLWSRADALAYVDHLFDFRSKDWAIDQGLAG